MPLKIQVLQYMHFNSASPFLKGFKFLKKKKLSKAFISQQKNTKSSMHHGSQEKHAYFTVQSNN
jgi:hypothetical protein